MLAVLVLLSAGACGNKNKNGNNNNNVEQIDFSVDGVQDITVAANETASIELDVIYSSGTQEGVTLSIIGLPETVIAEFSKDNGLPDYTSTLTIEGNMATDGVYPLTLTATSKSGVVKTYNLQLTITPFIDCASELARTYQAVKDCGGVNDEDIELTITQKQNSTTGIIISFEKNEMPATVDCAEGKINIPEYTREEDLGGITTTTKVTGSGSFDANSVTITVTQEFTIPPDYVSYSNCTITMQR